MSKSPWGDRTRILAQVDTLEYSASNSFEEGLVPSLNEPSDGNQTDNEEDEKPSCQESRPKVPSQEEDRCQGKVEQGSAEEHQIYLSFPRPS